MRWGWAEVGTDGAREKFGSAISNIAQIRLAWPYPRAEPCRIHLAELNSVDANSAVRQNEMNDLIWEFREWVDGVYGTYMDALSGFPLVQAEYEKMKAGTWPAPVDSSQAGRSVGSGRQIFTYARLVKGGKADRPTHIHQVNMETVIERNAFLGKNTVFVGRMAIVAIYGYWNDHTRVRIEEHLGWARDSLSVPIMGDIRHIRDMIVHNRSAADAGVRKLEVLAWPKEGEVISPSKDNIEDMIDRIMEFLEKFDQNPEAYHSK